VEAQKQVISRELVQVKRELTTNPCRCGTTSCSTTCGCKRNGLKCNPAKCGCKGVDCCNPASYEATPEGAALHKEAVAKYVAKEVARRAEAGRM
jgi:hypothetical protein